MLEELEGFLPVDKPAGLAFSSVVKAVKRKFNLVKVGHGGSLDATASGIFVLIFGDATKFTDEVMGADRTYTGTLTLGLKTSTHDIHGEKLAEKTVDSIETSALERALGECRGDIFQTEPRFSTIRKEGTAGYEIADTGDHKPFLAHVYRFSVGSLDDPASVPFELKATKGVLPRTLVNDFGEALGTGAALKSLRRLSIGNFNVDAAIPFDRLLETEPHELPSLVLPVAKALAR